MLFLKVVAKPIEVTVWFDTNGAVYPTKFKVIKEDEVAEIIKIDKIIKQAKERIAGNYMLIFTCQSLINGAERVYEIRYEINACKWILYKI